MMEQDSILKWQAYVDGELPSAERQALERQLESDAEARRLVAQLRAVNAALGVFESTVKVPVSREFYWGGIERQILLQNARSNSQPVPIAVDWLERLRRFLLPAGVVALLAIVSMLALNQPSAEGTGRVSQLKASLATAGTFTYRNFDSGTTLVWVSYPAENKFADFDAAFKLPEQ